MKKTAVLLLSFGGPDSLAAIGPFLKNVLNGRPISQGMTSNISDRYKKIGGKSPIADITFTQAMALQKSLLQKDNSNFKVFIGMRHWCPFIKDTLIEIDKEGYEKIIAICMTPQRSNYSSNGYEKDMQEGIKSLNAKPEVIFIPEWHLNKQFHKAVAEKINEAMIPFKANGEKTSVIFSAHSLPLKFMGSDDPYIDQVNETINGVLAYTGSLDWKLAYQSKGLTPGQWLEPTVDDIIDKLPEGEYGNLLIVPIVFVTDHIETLYDIDIIYKEKVESLGLNFRRSQSLNDSPKFIEALSEIVIENI